MWGKSSGWLNEGLFRCLCLVHHCPIVERAKKLAIARGEWQGVGSMAPGGTQQEAGKAARPEFSCEIGIDGDRGEVGVFGASESVDC
jgi:hypothetical protein